MNCIRCYVALVVFAAVVCSTLSAAELAKPGRTLGNLRVYVGTYTYKNSKGIYVCPLDPATGKLGAVSLAGETANPSFVALHPSRPLLYAVGEIGNFGGKKKEGAVSAFSVEPKTGKLTLLNQQPSGGGGPCHVVVDRAGRNVLVANYGGGSVACLPLRDDGRLAEPSCVVQHVGSSVHPKRQQGPHAHSIYVTADNRFALAADLGLDKILIYRLDAATGKLEMNRPAWATTTPGAGPRHLGLHPSGRYVYAINELSSTVTAFRYDAATGAMESLQEISTLPAGFEGSNTTSEIAVHPSGKFLYGSNRGHNSIAIFAIDAETGKLRAAGHESTQGKTPRGFGIDPTGSYLVAANQDSGTMVAFRIDAASGRLQATGEPIEVPSPVCVEIIHPME